MTNSTHRFSLMLLSLLVLPGLAALTLSSQNPAVLRRHLENFLDLNVTVTLTPPAGAWEQTGSDTYFANGYELSFEETSVGGRSAVKVSVSRNDGSKFTLEDFQVSCSLSRPDLFAIWTYNHVPAQHRNYRVLATESFWDLAAPNSGIPYALVATRDGTNVLAMGLLSQNRIVNMQGQPLAEGGYQISLDTRLPERTDRFEETVYADTTSTDWYETTRQYSGWVDVQRDYQPFPISPACFYPLYDTWYWAYDDTNMGLYWTTINQARQLGFRSYLFDAGWESEQGELFKWLQGSTGNYSAPEDKLMSFAGFLGYVRDRLRMNVILWMAPYAQGRESLYYRNLRSSHVLLRRDNSEFNGGIEGVPMTLPLGSRWEENVNLCPRHPKTHSHLKALFERVSGEYAPNGYWLDFQDTIPFLCESFHQHPVGFGEGFKISQDVIKQSVLERISRPTVELRFPVANLNTKPHANLWQSIDSPGDYDMMRLCSLMMRPFSRGIVMGTDEMYWPADADEKTVGKFVATTVLSGVPAIGADFQKAPRFHSDIVRAWLRFYKEHQDELTAGEFQPFGDFTFPNHKIESARTAFVYLRSLEPGSEIRLAQSPETVFLVNCTDNDHVSATIHGLTEGEYLLEVSGASLKPFNYGSFGLEGVCEISQEVPQGGMLKLSQMP
jgi:hypothetical protein